MFQHSIALFLSLTVLSSFVAAQQPPPAKPPAPAATAQGKDAPKDAPKKATFAVIMDGKDAKVVSDSSLDAMKKEKRKAHEAAMAEFEKAKKAAEAAKTPFDKKAPAEVMVEVKKDGFASEADAKKFIEDMMKKVAPAVGGDAKK